MASVARIPAETDRSTGGIECIARARRALGIAASSSEVDIAQLPFGPGDVTAGVENELQTVVIGEKDTVDLPLSIANSSYFKHILRQAKTGDSPQRRVSNLEHFLNVNSSNVWENSWVRFPHAMLSRYAQDVFAMDMLADKCDPDSPRRCDCSRFEFQHDGQRQLRVPVSYLLKLALADVISRKPDTVPMVRRTGERLMYHFLSDNTSPETFSFAPVEIARCGQTRNPLTAETLKRHLLTHLLVVYANQRFALAASGQRVKIYMAPNPPVRQKALNELISDNFYRELFMSPCLSGWNRGEKKQGYMHLCHQVLSRSQLNAVRKLKDAGIITSNLIVLPNTSNISLANNGTHVSLGSRKLTRLMTASPEDFGAAEEKYVGDLVIKIVEHFLPLFVNLYSAAPYRLDFWDFHPEKVLGFLPHELDFTHLRMIWRRWRKKARLRVAGTSLSPFGPLWLDKTIGRLFRLRGDLVSDFRIVDYPLCLMSSHQNPALNGICGNQDFLKTDLEQMGIFDRRMAIYLPFRLREHQTMGFSGFEGRFFSQFPSIGADMTPAVELQILLTALAFKWVMGGKFGHHDIPDQPAVESERRQAIFATAIGIPTFYVKQRTPNRLLTTILKHTRQTRLSRRYHGYVRIKIAEYRKALLALIRSEAADLIEAWQAAPLLDDLAMRIDAPQHAAVGKLLDGIKSSANIRNPMRSSGREFNMAAEAYYRNTLHRAHLKEALDIFKTDLAQIDTWDAWRQGTYNRALLKLLDGRNAADAIGLQQDAILAGEISADRCATLIQALILTIHHDLACAEGSPPQ